MDELVHLYGPFSVAVTATDLAWLLRWQIDFKLTPSVLDQKLRHSRTTGLVFADYPHGSCHAHRLSSFCTVPERFLSMHYHFSCPEETGPLDKRGDNGVKKMATACRHDPRRVALLLKEDVR